MFEDNGYTIEYDTSANVLDMKAPDYSGRMPIDALLTQACKLVGVAGRPDTRDEQKAMLEPYFKGITLQQALMLGWFNLLGATYDEHVRYPLLPSTIVCFAFCTFDVLRTASVAMHAYRTGAHEHVGM